VGQLYGPALLPRALRTPACGGRGISRARELASVDVAVWCGRRGGTAGESGHFGNWGGNTKSGKTLITVQPVRLMCEREGGAAVESGRRR